MQTLVGRAHWEVSVGPAARVKAPPLLPPPRETKAKQHSPREGVGLGAPRLQRGRPGELRRRLARRRRVELYSHEAEGRPLATHKPPAVLQPQAGTASSRPRRALPARMPKALLLAPGRPTELLLSLPGGPAGPNQPRTPERQQERWEARAPSGALPHPNNLRKGCSSTPFVDKSVSETAITCPRSHSWYK